MDMPYIIYIAEIDLWKNNWRSGCRIQTTSKTCNPSWAMLWSSLRSCKGVSRPILWGKANPQLRPTKPTPDHPKATPKAKVAATPKVSAAKAKPAAKSTPSPTPPPAASGDGEKALLALGFFHLNFKFGNVFQSKKGFRKDSVLK